MTKFDFKQWIINNKAANKKAKKAEILNEQAPPMTLCSLNNNVSDCHQFQECVGNSFGPTTNFQAGNPFANGDELWLALGQPSPGQTRKDTTNNVKYKYIGVGDGTFVAAPLPQAWINSCCGVAGCMNSAAGNYNSAATCGCNGNDPSDDSCCQGPGYTECINCCCNAHMQMENVMEDTNPTIDAVSKLITLAEQRRRTDDAEREPSRRERPTISRPEDQPKGKGGKIRPSDDIKFSAAAPVSGGDPAVAPGACSANHYTSTQPWTLIDTTAPDISTLDPATGLCECDPTAYPTVATIHNPSPQTVDANNYPQGQSAPCP